MNKIPFPKVLLSPCNQRQLAPLYNLSERVFPRFMKDAFLERISYYNMVDRPNFPVEPKEFYLIPFHDMKATFSQHRLQLPEFSALWMPSLASKVDEIRDELPEDSKEIAIVAYDYGFSAFVSGCVLVADISMGFTTFVFWENNRKRFDDDLNCWTIAELVPE